MLRLIARALVRVEERELPALRWAFGFFFCVLACNYLLKPIRDAFGLLGGTRNIPWLYTGTFVTMLVAAPIYGAMAARLPRRSLVRAVFGFFALNLLAFWFLFQNLAAPGQVQLSRVFYVWHAVFNLFVVSVFWSCAVEAFPAEAGKRLFGFIAAGGTLGGLTGSALASQLSEAIGTTDLMLVPIAFLLGAVHCAHGLASCLRHEPAAAAPLGGDPLGGVAATFSSPYLLGIAGYLFLLTLSNTFLYQVQNTVYAQASDSVDTHTGWFASVNTLQQAATLVVQAVFAAHLIRWLGLALTLTIPCLLGAAGFTLLGLSPSLTAVTLVVAVLGAARYAVYSPARETLFTVVPREQKYKAKGFIDTAVYRGGDVVHAWLYRSLGDVGLSMAAICFLTLPVCGVWALLALFLGRRQVRMATQPPPSPAVLA